MKKTNPGMEAAKDTVMKDVFTSSEFICIICPNSCRLRVTENAGKITVTGNECPQGERHGIHEYQNPTRILTTTVAVSGGTLPRLPVISTGEIPKIRINQCLELLYKIKLRAPLRCGDIIVKNICGTGVDVAASRSMKSPEAGPAALAEKNKKDE
jgi:CxxC motif-containing protein